MKKYLDPLLPGETFHVYNRAVGNDLLFKSKENYRHFLNKFADHTGSISDVYCYSLLPNHFHFLLRMKTEEELRSLDLTGFQNLSGLGFSTPLSQQFSNCFNSYAKSFNDYWERMGTLFMRPFKRKQVESDSYFTQLIHYVHANPVHHGYCKTIDEWEFSSYKSLLSDQPTRLLRNDVMEWFGGKRQFEIFHQQPIICRSGWEFD